MRKTTFCEVVAVLLCMLPVNAGALPVVLTLDDEPILQQIDNTPCIIGNPSCKNPALFDYTLLAPNTETDSVDSPEYTVQQIRDLVGDTFFVGIDLQQAQLDYQIDLFTMAVNSVVVATFGPSIVPLSNHGNGFSDAVLLGFDLSGFLGTDTVLFHLEFSGNDSEREQFFLGAAGGGTEVPEPASAALFGIGLIGAALRRKMAA